MILFLNDKKVLLQDSKKKPKRQNLLVCIGLSYNVSFGT